MFGIHGKKNIQNINILIEQMFQIDFQLLENSLLSHSGAISNNLYPRAPQTMNLQLEQINKFKSMAEIC